MGEKFRNVVCEPKDFFEQQKRQLFELINLNKTVCNNLPDISVPDLIPNVPDINPSQKIIDLLTDVIALLSGINFDEMKMQLVNWLVEQLEPLSEDLSVNFVNSIKSCYACKIEPTIPEWLFQTEPSTGVEGVGLNIELNKIDLSCIFANNPNTEIGKLFYDGDSSKDIDSFLWEVIQEDGNPLIWYNPTNNKPIFEVRYYEDSSIAFTQISGNTVTYQNIEARQRVFNIRLINSTYENKSLITVLVDYFDSQQPLFNPDKVIPDIIDLMYGTLTNKVDLPDECLIKKVEMDKSIDDYIENGIDTKETVFDDSFYTFDNVQLKDIRNTVKQKKSGVREYRKCCGKETSTISFDTINDINKKLSESNNLQEKITTYTNAIDDLIKESTANVKDLNVNGASGEFLSTFITTLQISLTRLVLSPKNLLMLNLFYFLVNSKPVTEISIKKILKEYECIIRDIISEIIRKIIYDYLLPMALKTAKQLILCVVTKKIKEKHLNFLKSKKSLLPSFITESLENVNELLGEAESAVDTVRGFTDKVNLDSLNNINLEIGKKGRFCD